MINIADMLREITRGPGFIQMTEPHAMDLPSMAHHMSEATFEEVCRARSMRSRGIPIKLIAATLGRSTNTVRDWVYMRTRKTA